MNTSQMVDQDVHSLAMTEIEATSKYVWSAKNYWNDSLLTLCLLPVLYAAMKNYIAR
jgi:hypothetical protein